MSPRTVATMAILTLAPIFELRGGIPYGIAKGVPIGVVLPICIGLNALVGPIAFLFLNTGHRLFIRAPLYERIVVRILERARRKVEPKIARFGFYGLLLFVAIPLPITGAYTGAFGAWVLGLEARKALLAISGGVVVAAGIVTAVTLLGIEALAFFVKEIPS